MIKDTINKTQELIDLLDNNEECSDIAGSLRDDLQYFIVDLLRADTINNKLPEDIK